MDHQEHVTNNKLLFHELNINEDDSIIFNDNESIELEFENELEYKWVQTIKNLLIERQKGTDSMNTVKFQGKEQNTLRIHKFIYVSGLLSKFCA